MQIIPCVELMVMNIENNNDDTETEEGKAAREICGDEIRALVVAGKKYNDT